VSSGFFDACGIRRDGTLACWGETEAVRSPPAGSFKQVSVGNAGACAVRADQRVVCWGMVAKPPEALFSDVSVTMDFACGIAATTGALWCWGRTARQPL